MQPQIPAPHIGQMLKAHTRSRKISHSAWQQAAGKSYNTIIKYQKQASMRVDTLFAICQTLNYNFLRDIANRLPATMPPQPPADNAPETLAALQQQVRDLQLQVATLEKALALVGGR